MTEEKTIPERHEPTIVGAIGGLTSSLILLFGGRLARAMYVVQGHNRWLLREVSRLEKRVEELEGTELSKRVNELEDLASSSSSEASRLQSENCWLKRRLKKLEAYQAWVRFGRRTTDMTEEQWEAHWTALGMVEDAPPPAADLPRVPVYLVTKDGAVAVAEHSYARAKGRANKLRAAGCDARMFTMRAAEEVDLVAEAVKP